MEMRARAAKLYRGFNYPPGRPPGPTAARAARATPTIAPSAPQHHMHSEAITHLSYPCTAKCYCHHPSQPHRDWDRDPPSTELAADSLSLGSAR